VSGEWWMVGGGWWVGWWMVGALHAVPADNALRLCMMRWNYLRNT
jgi:hypothetical protein